MSELHGQQFIFTRVEPEYSPKQYGGYQMVYHSPGLPPALIAICEERVKSFHPPVPTLARWQFFAWEDFVVLTHSVQVATVREISDRDGRPGIFLCHGLVFPVTDFAALAGNNPFLVFDHYAFLKDVHQLVAQYNHREGREPACQVLMLPDIPPEKGWLKEAPKFVELAYRAQQLKAQKQFLLFFGDEADILAALRLMFYLTPANERLACVFDTFAERLENAGGQWWAAGVPEYQAGGAALVNCRSARIDGFTSASTPSDLYLVWLLQHMNRPADEILQQAPSIQELTRAFRENRPFLADNLLLTGCESFLEQFRPQIIERLRATYAAQLPPALVPAFLEHLFRMEEAPYILSVASARRFPRGRLISQVKDWLKTQAPLFSALKSEHWEKLAELARKESDPVVKFWAAVYTRDEKARVQALGEMNPSDYEDAAVLLFNPLGLSVYLHPGHIEAWMTLFSQRQGAIQRNEDWVTLTLMGIEAGGAPWLGSLAERVACLDHKQLARLEKSLGKTPAIASEFLWAIQQQRQRVGASAGLLDKVIQWFMEEDKPQTASPSDLRTHQENKK